MTLITCYNPLPISFSHGEGVWLYDHQGRAYLDSFSGIGVCGLGHAHPEITKVIHEQAARLLHVSNGFLVPEQQQLAEKITEMTGMQQAFFCNSGAEANEAALKLARLYGHKKGIETPCIIVMERAFHGRTLATLTASGSRKVQAGFEPLMPGFIRAPFNDLNAIRTIAEHRDDIVAIMLEPIQGEGGVRVAEETYLHGIAELCKQQDWMLILDEVQTGNGRTGNLFVGIDPNIQPDIITTAKGLANGIPIGACLMRNRACDLFKPGNHGSTFGGNPFACRVALTVLDILENDNICEKVMQNGIILKEKLLDKLSGHELISAIRGKGYMLGIELTKPAHEIKSIALHHGLLLNVTAEHVIRLLPPLVMNEEELDELAKRLCQTIDQFNQILNQ